MRAPSRSGSTRALGGGDQETDDESVQKAWQKLEYHYRKFSGVAAGERPALLRRYRRQAAAWVLAGQSDTILQYTFHVCAWATFAEEDLESIVELLMFMLRARGRTRPVHRLAYGLGAVRDRIEALQEEEPSITYEEALHEIEKALRAAVPIVFGGDTSAAKRQPAVPKGTYGKTDQALVRRTLGQRQLPDGCRITWDGHPQRMRWYGSAPGRSHLPGSNATRRMYSDADAINHAYKAIMAWATARDANKLCPRKTASDAKKLCPRDSSAGGAMESPRGLDEPSCSAYEHCALNVGEEDPRSESGPEEPGDACSEGEDCVMPIVQKARSAARSTSGRGVLPLA